MTKKELEEKYSYVQVSIKYDIVKAHDLLEKIGIPVLEDDEHKIQVLKLDDSKYLKNAFDGTFFIIRSGGEWVIQVHYLGMQNTIEELEEDVNSYCRSEARKNLGESEKEELENRVSDFNQEVDSFMCYFYNNFQNKEDIDEVREKFHDLFEKISKRYKTDFKSFRKDDKFEEKFKEFTREQKLNELT